MNKRIKHIFVFLFLIFPLNVQANDQFLPEPGKTFMFIGQDKETIDRYIQDTGHEPYGFMVYTSVQEMDGLTEPADHGAGVHHAQYWADRFPGARFQIGLYMVNALDAVLEGKYDSNLQKLGDWLKQVNVPVYLRIGYEFDLPDNKYKPETYKEVFRYIVDHLREQGVDNTAYVWHSYGYLNPDKPMMDWYPGDEYVDFVGVSFFKAFNAGNMKFMMNRAKEHGKPFMIAEATPFGTGTLDGDKSWNMWFKPFFQFINENDIPVVSYINSEWETLTMFQGQGWGDARVQANETVKERWLAELNTERYQLAGEEK